MSPSVPLPAGAVVDLMPWVREQLGDVIHYEQEGPSVRGHQAEIAFLQTRDASMQEVVLKVLVGGEATWTLNDEFQALMAMHSALAGRPDIDCPQPLAIHPGGRAYLMTKVEGRPLDRVELSVQELDTTIDLLLDALSLYYGAVGDIYGDLQPSNVLVGDASIALIDPTLPAPIHRQIQKALAHAPASADIGYWTYSVVSRSFAGAVRHPQIAARRTRATRSLLQKAPRHFQIDEAAFASDVTHAVKARLARLMRLGPLKGRALQASGSFALRRLQRGAR